MYKIGNNYVIKGCLVVNFVTFLLNVPLFTQILDVDSNFLNFQGYWIITYTFNSLSISQERLKLLIL